MNLKIGSALKALGVLIGLILGSDVIDGTKIDQIVGALTVLATVGWDLFETFRLQQQGIVSTKPQANVEAPGSPQELAAKENQT